MPFKVRDVRRSLKTKGFVEDNEHHKYLYFYYKGKATALYTYTSHGKDSDDVGDGIVGKMKRQLGLRNNGQVNRLIECSMSEADYIKFLIEQNQLPAE